MRIMGIDPGGKTGIVVWDEETSSMLHVVELFAGGDHNRELAVVRDAIMAIRQYGVKLVIIEDFILRSQPGGGGVSTARVSLSPSRIGFGIAAAIQQDASVSREVEAVMRPSGDAISIMTNDRLRRLGMYVKYPGGGEHVRDAARHVALELRKRR